MTKKTEKVQVLKSGSKKQCPMYSCWLPSVIVKLHTTACIEAKLNPEEQLYNEPMFQARIDVAEILDSVQCQVAEPVEKEDQVLSPCEIKWR